jgi:hypothetical protein
MLPSQMRRVPSVYVHVMTAASPVSQRSYPFHLMARALNAVVTEAVGCRRMVCLVVAWTDIQFK